MIINKLTVGQKKITIFYVEGTDEKVLTSEEKARPELYDALGLLSQNYQISLAQQRGEEPDTVLSRWERNVKTVSFKYEEGQVIPETYSISGGEHMKDTNFHSRFSVSGIKFGTKYNPDQAVLNVLDEAKRYVKGDRAQMSLFPKEAK